MASNEFQHGGKAPSHGVWDPASNQFYPTKDRASAEKLAAALNVRRPRGEQKTTKNHVRRPGDAIPKGSQIVGASGSGRSGSRFGHLLADLILWGLRSGRRPRGRP